MIVAKRAKNVFLFVIEFGKAETSQGMNNTFERLVWKFIKHLPL
jgi:hypothetical protein